MGEQINAEQGNWKSCVSCMIRGVDREDYKKLKEIHERFYKTEFDFPNFVDKFLCSFVVVNEDNNDIICGGGVRTLCESVLLTNKDYSPRLRKQALHEVLTASVHFTEKFGYHELHAFVQDQQWEHHLRKIGFSDTVGKALVLGV